jgi:Uma2 family endonuclease
MSTITPPHVPMQTAPAPAAPHAARVTQPSDPTYVFLTDIRWETYEALVEDVNEQHVRITYDEGRMVIMSPLPIHEKLKKVMGMLIEAAAMTLNVPMSTLGSTTWKRKDIRKGLEADECYYIQNEARVRALMEFDLTRDPPPDLAVEVDVTHNPLDRPSIYAQLRVNEIWRHDGEHLQFLLLAPDGKYAAAAVSQAFPMLTPVVIEAHLALIGTVSDTEIPRRFREWLLQNVPAAGDEA